MAKGIYIGVDSKARKVKKAYVGVAEDSLITNGDFSNGLEGWAVPSIPYITYTVKNGILTATYSVEYGGSKAVDGVSYSLDMKEGHKYYFSVYYKSIQGTPYIFLGGEIKVGNTGDWVKVSNIAEKKEGIATSCSLGIFFGTDREYLIGDSCQYKEVKAYDLTALFGTGNEPTKEWCDNNLETLSVARKVKKGYIGVGGKARLFFSSDKELSYYGTATDLSAARYGLAGASVGNYALFAGGRDKSTNYGTVESYNTSLTRASRASITARCFLASASVGNYALFAGGYNYSSTYYNNVDAFISTNLARTTATALGSSVAKFAGASVGDYAIFAGGTSNATGAFSNTCAYNSSLVQSTPSTLKTARYNLAGTSVGDYAIFGGGETASSRTNTVDAYNLSLTRSTPTAFSASKKSYAAANVGDYALFAGGYTTTSLSTVEVYNTTLTKSTPTELSLARTQLAGVSVDGYAIFAGGQNSSKKQSAVDVYDVTLTRTTPTELSVARFILAAASVGNYALFAGGYDGGTTSSGAIPYATVDVYQSI